MFDWVLNTPLDRPKFDLGEFSEVLEKNEKKIFELGFFVVLELGKLMIIETNNK